MKSWLAESDKRKLREIRFTRCRVFHLTTMAKIKEEEMMISKELIEILACPQCKGAVKLKGEQGIICEKCKLLYEIKDDIPIMLVDEAKRLK